MRLRGSGRWYFGTGVMALRINPLISLKAVELWLPIVRSQFSSPKAVMLLFIPLTWVSECVLCFRTPSDRWEISTKQAEPVGSNIAVSEKVMPLMATVVLPNGNCCMGLNTWWWVQWTGGRTITYCLVRTENPAPRWRRCSWLMPQYLSLRREPERDVGDDMDSYVRVSMRDPLHNSCIWRVLDCNCGLCVPNSCCGFPWVWHCVVSWRLSVASEIVVYLFLVVALVYLVHFLDSIAVVCACNMRSTRGWSHYQSWYRDRGIFGHH